MCLEIISQIDGRGYQKVISLFVERAAFHDEVNLLIEAVHYLKTLVMLSSGQRGIRN